MRPLALLRTGCLLLAMGALPWPPAIGFVDPPSTSTSPPKDQLKAIEGDPIATLDRGQEFERRRNWSAAIQVYRDATIKWPSRSEFRSRLRLAEMHQRLVRRYQDGSFRDILLRLSREKAFDLFDELVERIEIHYVDAVALEPLIRRGFDNLEVALRDPKFAFLTINAPNHPADRVDWLRDQLRARREALFVPDRETARDQVVLACDLARQALGIAPAPIILEFVFGCCDALPDDYTAYLTPDKLDDMLATIDGNFVGLGVELKNDDAGLKLVGVIRGGPAFDAGLKPGDRIVAVAGQSVKGLGLDDAAGRLQGSEGTSVDISVLRPDGATKVFRLVRRHVEVESVGQAKLIEPGSVVGYIQLTGFQKSSTEELDRAISRLKRQGMQYLVLDLRGNPGGLLNVSVEIADRFVDQGVIVSTRGRAPGQTQVYRAKPDKPYTMPLAVLIDRDSASASEILAGALQELKRAVVIGDRSYGKGSVQSIFELKSAPAGLKLTTAKFYSPRNRAYSEAGVTPDILHVVTAKPSSYTEPEADLPEFGDPETDEVLKLALKEARRQLSVNR
jgi:carboxyl-terminal processing protease